MVKIRLRRTGTKSKPNYRMVVVNSQSSVDGAFISIVGHYNPRTEPETVVINEEQVLHWLSQGAQPTATVARLLTKAGITEKFKAIKEKA